MKMEFHLLFRVVDLFFPTLAGTKGFFESLPGSGTGLARPLHKEDWPARIPDFKKRQGEGNGYI